MKRTHHSAQRTSQVWELEQFSVRHHVIHYDKTVTTTYTDEEELVRLHFGLAGAYDFTCRQLDQQFQLQGSHNNILYTQGLSLELTNRTEQLESFGLHFTTTAFLQLAQEGNEALKRFADKVAKQQPSLLSERWLPNTFSIQQIVREILHCPFQAKLQSLFLLSKSIELLVHQAALYETAQRATISITPQEEEKLLAAKAILDQRLDNPPNLPELAKLVHWNQYQLKKKFKARFACTAFAYLHGRRMSLAKRMLLDTQQSIKEIAFEMGYSSPQHFSKAFKKEFGCSPNSIRKKPNRTLP